MATQRVPKEFVNSAKGGEDLSTKTFYLAHMESDETIELATAGELVAGVIQEGKNTGEYSTYQHGGIAKVVTGAGVRAGQRVQSDALGRAIEGSSNAFGTSISDVPSAGMIVEVQLD